MQLVNKIAAIAMGADNVQAKRSQNTAGEQVGKAADPGNVRFRDHARAVKDRSGVRFGQ